MKWFRMYADAVDNAKLRLLAFEDRWHYTALLCLKCDGVLDSATNAAMLNRVVAVKLGLQLPAVDELYRRLVEVNLITENWQPIGWDDRQFESDNAAARQRRWREKQLEKKTRNVTVTSVSRDSDVTVTTQDTDTEKERKKDIRARARCVIPDGLDIAAWDRFVTYRREIRKPIKPASMQAAQKKLAGFGTDQSAVVEQSIANSWTGIFELRHTVNGKRQDERNATERTLDDLIGPPERFGR